MGTTILLSAEEFLNLPDMPGKQELLEGELVYPEAPSMTVFRKGSREQVTGTYESSLVGVTVDLHRMVQPSA